MAPLWRRAFDAVERPLGDALAQGARSGAFADVVAVGVRLERRLQREIERRTRRALHLVNLPAATDVRRLNQQVTELQRQVRALSRELEKTGKR
jgi:polyhydroxyalkanoate synthesis regulator phasin